MDKTKYIVAGGFIDGCGGAVRRNIFLAVQNGVIIGIGPAADLPRNEGAVINEFPHCTIVPPLVDSSVSLARSPSVDEKIRVAAEESTLVKQHIGYCYDHGVLGAAVSDDQIDLGENLNELKSQGIFIDIRAAGNDFFRINYSGNINDAEAHDALDRAELSRIEKRGNKKTVVVANGHDDVQEALAAGCDAIEQGYGMGEDNLRQMAEMGVLWIPSVLRAQNGMLGSVSGGDVMCRFSMRYAAPGKPDPSAEAFWKKMLAEQLTQLSQARRVGVRTALGTGAGSVGILHGESMVEEIKLFIRAGYSLEETIQCASENSARFFKMENLGSLTVGHKATFLLARGTVQQLPRKLSYLETIYVDGAPSKAF